jgi:hypothetical protein
MNNDEPMDIRTLIHHGDYSSSMDLRGESIGDICLCGSELFIALVSFDQGELSFYFLDGECASCGSMVTLPYPNTETEGCE